jgi:hypothetical protein
MKDVIREGHRRSLWQVLGIYLAGSRVALQVVNEIAAAGTGPAGTLVARGALEEAALVVLADFEAEDDPQPPDP